MKNAPSISTKSCTASRMMRFWSAVPWLALASVYLLAFRFLCLLGRLPSRATNDVIPRELLSQTLYVFAEVAFVSLLLSPFCWLFFFMMNLQHMPSKTQLLHAVLFLAGLSLFWLLSRTDPKGLFEWWCG